MTSKLRLLSMAFLAAFAMVFTSCSDDEALTVETSDNLTETAMRSLQNGAVGRGFCLEFVYPITVQFVDGSTASAEDHESLRATIKAWFETNEVEKNRENKPQLVFPVEVLNQEGEVIEVASREELRELRKECPRPGKKNCHGRKCFELVFPISLTIDGEDVSFDDKQSMREAVRAYKQEAGDDFVRPTLVFPVTIEFEDGTQQSIASKEELKAAKDACAEG